MRTVAISLSLVFVFCIFAAAESPQELVNDMVHNELAAQRREHHHWMYLDSNTKEDGTIEVREVVETSEGALKRLVSINGHPPSSAELARDAADREKLLSDPSVRQKQLEDSKKDDQQARNMLKMLPQAFIYTDAGEENGLRKLAFRPNPNFNPPTREARVFHCMQGTMLINPREKRLAKLAGKLVSDVDFGWGLLGRLHKGGIFQVDQVPVVPGDWEISLLDVHITGKALFFKSISEQQHETKTKYKLVPYDLSLKQADALLSGQGAQSASLASR